MNIRELREALAALGPEYDESVVLVLGTGLNTTVATRLITIPVMSNVEGYYSYEEFDRAVWISDGGTLVSREAEADGWAVPYHNPIRQKSSRHVIPK